MRTKAMLKRAKPIDAGNVITHALAMNWTPSMIQKHGNKHVRAAMKAAGGVEQLAVEYKQTTLVTVPTAKGPITRRGRRTPELRSAANNEKVSFDAAERIEVSYLRNGETSYGYALVNPERPKVKGKSGKTHDVLYVFFNGETASSERKTLSPTALVRMRGGERTHVWLDGHSYVVIAAQ
jgi:hypothetical protein